jgi:hypothetical protein
VTTASRRPRDRVGRRLGELASDPVAWTELIQVAKTAVAAVLAWVLAARVLELPQSFLAPWSALLVVHATVYRSFSRGVRQVTGAVLGVLLAWCVGNVAGLSTASVTVLLVLGLGIGATRWFRDESTVVAATGLLVLTTGLSGRDNVLMDRLVDTAVGVLVGLAINLAVWPPLRDYAAARAVDAIDDAVGALLSDMAAALRRPCTQEQVEQWVARTRALDDDLDRAWSLLRQARESSRLNPRRAALGLRHGALHEDVLRGNEQAVAEARSMAHTLGHSIEGMVEWEGAFRTSWLDLLAEAGEAIAAPDPQRLVGVRAGLNALADALGTGDLSSRHWPEYGALIVNLRNVVTSMDRVARLNPVVVPRYTGRYRSRLPGGARRVRR